MLFARYYIYLFLRWRSLPPPLESNFPNTPEPRTIIGMLNDHLHPTSYFPRLYNASPCICVYSSAFYSGQPSMQCSLTYPLSLWDTSSDPACLTSYIHTCTHVAPCISYGPMYITSFVSPIQKAATSILALLSLNWLHVIGLNFYLLTD